MGLLIEELRRREEELRRKEKDGGDAAPAPDRHA